VLVSNEENILQIDDDILTSAIINAETTSDSIEIIMKHASNWNEGKTMEVLAKLPAPYKEIPLYGKRPKLEHNELNLKFAKLLQDKKFISTIKEDKADGSITINTFMSKIH